MPLPGVVEGFLGSLLGPLPTGLPKPGKELVTTPGDRSCEAEGEIQDLRNLKVPRPQENSEFRQRIHRNPNGPAVQVGPAISVMDEPMTVRSAGRSSGNRSSGQPPQQQTARRKPSHGKQPSGSNMETDRQKSKPNQGQTFGNEIGNGRHGRKPRHPILRNRVETDLHPWEYDHFGGTANRTQAVGKKVRLSRHINDLRTNLSG